MKKLYFLIVVLIICQFAASSQSCLPNGIEFSSQAEIDSFQSNYPNCTEIEGDVIILGDDIANLNGLSVLTSIGGSLSIGTWSFEIGYVGNPALTNLTGIEGLTSIGGNFAIYGNDTLVNLTGLVNLTTVEGYLEIIANYVLTSITGLSNMTSVGGDLWISKTFALTSLTGLDNLTSIGGNLGISYNYGLTSLAGLEELNSIGGGINILDNNNMTSLSGLDNVTFIGERLWINYNNSLSTCEIQSICDYLANPSGNILINDNATGCNSQAEVKAACGITSIDEVHLTERLLIFPNPSSTQITIELPNTPQRNSFLTIYNINSQQLIARHITEQKTVIDVSALPTGFYFVKVSDERTVMVGKVVKK